MSNDESRRVDRQTCYKRVCERKRIMVTTTTQHRQLHLRQLLEVEQVLNRHQHLMGETHSLQVSRVLLRDGHSREMTKKKR